MNELFISYISILYALMCFLLREILYSNKKFKKNLCQRKPESVRTVAGWWELLKRGC